MNAREAAYQALLLSLRQEKFISTSLEQWQAMDHPSSIDYAFAQELAMGACRMAKSLDYFAACILSKPSLSVKLKEKALLRIALYQHYFMDKVPLYAIASEAMKLANKYCHRTFTPFLNALLRKMENAQISLPTGQQTENLSIRYSYPEFFVELLAQTLSLETLENVLEAGNCPAKTMMRLRSGWDLTAEEWIPYITPIKTSSTEAAVLTDKKGLDAAASSTYCYIQNITPATLVSELASQMPVAPKSILDLCASPGGKLLAAHDLFPEAELFGNDVSAGKLERLRDNFNKYQVPISLHCGNGETFLSDRTFDLIILDVPCSNSGVLNKRPEARWRLNEQTLAGLEEKQRQLIDHAVSLLSPRGVIWYMTCSILNSENETITLETSQKHALKKIYSQTILPNKDGWDGGYACLLTR